MKAKLSILMKFGLILSILLISVNSILSKISVGEVEPEIYDFVACESEPKVDLKKLNDCVKYPEKARRAGIVGNVIIRVLIDKDGGLRRSAIEESDSELLSKAAISALKCYGKFIPALQKGKPVMCWVSIPITFKLNNEVVEPKIDDIVKVDSEPWVNLDKLAECVEYHDKSRLTGRQSFVEIRALIGLKGEVVKSELEKTDNALVVDAALKAVNECAEFKPAMLNGTPVLCWITIPITFKLKGEEIEPSIDSFVRVDKDPEVDLNKLARCVEYPDVSRRAGIQGRVIVRTLVGIKGEVLKTVIEDTDNVTLNDAAMKAIKNCGDFKPAIVKGKPIICWVSIPITFRLKDPE